MGSGEKREQRRMELFVSHSCCDSTISTFTSALVKSQRSSGEKGCREGAWAPACWELGPRQGLRGPTFWMTMDSPSPQVSEGISLHRWDGHPELGRGTPPARRAQSSGPGYEPLSSILSSRANTRHIGPHLWAHLPSLEACRKCPSETSPSPVAMSSENPLHKAISCPVFPIIKNLERLLRFASWLLIH